MGTSTSPCYFPDGFPYRDYDWKSNPEPSKLPGRFHSTCVDSQVDNNNFIELEVMPQAEADKPACVVKERTRCNVDSKVIPLGTHFESAEKCAQASKNNKNKSKCGN
jgi:hypothetical protein